METASFELTFAKQPWGLVLSGDVVFEEDARCMLFAWNGNTVAWVKAGGYDPENHLSITYHPCWEDRVQLMMCMETDVSTQLMLQSRHNPQGPVLCKAALSRPSVLYTVGDHGVGLLAIQPELTKSRRKGLWHVKSEAVTEPSFLFEHTFRRHGLFSMSPEMADEWAAWLAKAEKA